MLSTDKQANKQTDRQTNQRYQKHNLLCQGGKNGHSLEFCGPILKITYNLHNYILRCIYTLNS